jgi:hypothetical protein
MGAHLLGAVVIAGYLVWLPPPRGRHALGLTDLLVSGAAFVAYLAVAFPLGYVHENRASQSALCWLELRGRTDSTRAYEPGPSPGLAAPAHALAPAPLADT